MDRLGTLVNYSNIQLGGYHRNFLDAAIAEPVHSADVAPGVRGIGAITGSAPMPPPRTRLMKMGWRTGFTAGEVFGTINFLVGYAGQNALLASQLIISGDDPGTGFAQQGESGAPVLQEDTQELAGMIVAVAPDAPYAMATPIAPVLSHFDISPCWS